MPEELGPRTEQLYSEHNQLVSELQGIKEVQQKESENSVSLDEMLKGLDSLVEELTSRIAKSDSSFSMQTIDSLDDAKQEIVSIAESYSNTNQPDTHDNAQRDEVQDKIDANLWKAQQHYKANEAGYKQQAVNEAQAVRKDVKYGPYTEDPIYNYNENHDVNSAPTTLTAEEFFIQNKQIQAERDAALADPTLSDDEKFDKFVEAHRKSQELEERSPFRNDPDMEGRFDRRGYAFLINSSTNVDELEGELRRAEKYLNDDARKLRRAEDLGDQDNIKKLEAHYQARQANADIIRQRIDKLREQDEDALSDPPAPPR